MPRYADVDKLLDYLDARAFAAVEMWDGEASRNAFLAVTDAVAHCTIIDAVDVVRCSDCKYAKTFRKYADMPYCGKHFGIKIQNDFFCADGEREMDSEVHDG